MAEKTNRQTKRETRNEKPAQRRKYKKISTACDPFFYADNARTAAPLPLPAPPTAIYFNSFSSFNLKQKH